MITLSWVMPGYRWYKVRYVRKMLILNHSSADIVTKLFNLLSDVFEESVA